MTFDSSPPAASLSNRGKQNAAVIDDKTKRMLQVFRDLYDPETNPKGIVSFGVADNSLMRPELLQYFNHNLLALKAAELTYADRIYASAKLLEALSDLFNNVPDGIPTGKPTKDLPHGGKGPSNVLKVEPEHIITGGGGASSILSGLFWSLCDEGDGVLLSSPYYNGFDLDSYLTSRAKIVEVHVEPEPQVDGSNDHLEKETLKYYEEAIEKAKKDGINSKVLLICNPHNPTGGIYSRSTIIEFCKFASKHSLHLIMDEIYARSIFSTKDVKNPEVFHSILTIDVLKEANLNPSNVSVVTSASKDFSVNGFRLGVACIQHNEDLRRSMTSLGILAQSSSPASALWYTFLNDGPFLAWYLRENRRRLTLAYDYVTDWFKHFQIPYVPSTSGHFFLCDLRKFLDVGDAKVAEGKLLMKLLDEKVFLAPGAQYHHPTPGWYRFTFTTSPEAIREGLARVEKVLGLESFSRERKLLDLKDGMEKCPNKYEDKQRVRNDFESLNLDPYNSSDDKGSIRKSWDTRDETVGHELEKGDGNEKKDGKDKRSLLSRLTCSLF